MKKRRTFRRGGLVDFPVELRTMELLLQAMQESGIELWLAQYAKNSTFKEIEVALMLDAVTRDNGATSKSKAMLAKEPHHSGKVKKKGETVPSHIKCFICDQNHQRSYCPQNPDGRGNTDGDKPFKGRCNVCNVCKQCRAQGQRLSRKRQEKDNKGKRRQRKGDGRAGQDRTAAAAAVRGSGDAPNASAPWLPNVSEWHAGGHGGATRASAGAARSAEAVCGSGAGSFASTASHAVPDADESDADASDAAFDVVWAPKHGHGGHAAAVETRRRGVTRFEAS